MTFPRVMKTTQNDRWGEVNLNTLAAQTVGFVSPNPLIDPSFCEQWVETQTKKLDLDHTWGGYGEDRSCLWNGHYLPPGHLVHLGVDLNVPINTPVHMPVAGVVAFVEANTDLGGGWGGWVVVKLNNAVGPIAALLFGHLAHASLPALGAVLAQGDVVGRVGRKSENGGWFPHLHLQALSLEAFEYYMDGRMEELDGYAPKLSDWFPDPISVLR